MAIISNEVFNKLKRFVEDDDSAGIQTIFVGNQLNYSSAGSDYHDNNTVLHLATQFGKLDLVRMLVEVHKVDSNVRNTNNETPLHLAAQYGHVTIVQYLVEEQGVDSNVTNKWNETPLHRAAKEGHFDIVQYLVEKQGVDSNVTSKWSETPLHIAAECGHIDVVQCLAGQQGVDIYARNIEKQTPLHIATINGHVTVVQYLVEEKGVDVMVTNTENETPLHLAVKYGHITLVQYLVDKQGADINCQNGGGQTPLHLATMYSHIEIMKYISTVPDLDFSLRNNADKTALFLAEIDNVISRTDLIEIIAGLSDTTRLSDPVSLLEDIYLMEEHDPKLVPHLSGLIGIAVESLPSSVLDDAKLRFVFYKGNLYIKLIKYFLDKSNLNRGLNRESLLKKIYIALQAKITCDQSKRKLLKHELGEELYEQFSLEIKELASWVDDQTERNRLQLIAYQMYSDYFEDHESCISCVEFRQGIMTCISCNENKTEKEGAGNVKDGSKGCIIPPELYHRCKARGIFAVGFCILGMVIYVLDIYSDLIVGLDDYEGFSRNLGIFEICLVMFTLVHENIKSAFSLYETERELLRIKLGKVELKPTDWKQSDLNYHTMASIQWLYILLWPFNVTKTSGYLQTFKAILLNILTMLMMRPLVDRLIVLLHAPISLRTYYRHQVEQNSLRQFYLILEQLPELTIQFYTFQIVFNNLITPAHLDEAKIAFENCEQQFYDDTIEALAGTTTNSFCTRLSLHWTTNLVQCSTAFRIFSMSIPFFSIPSGIVSLEEGFRTLDSLTPKMSSAVKYLVHASYTLMIPARVFMLAGMMHAVPDNSYVICYFCFIAFLELLVTLFYHKAAARYLIKEKKVYRKLGNYWRLIVFAIRDMFVISLRDHEAYMEKPTKVSYKSLRRWNSLAQVFRSFHFVCEGLVGALYIEFYYPCGKHSKVFGYLGWFCLLLLIFSLTLLNLLSGILHPPKHKSLPNKFLKESLIISFLGLLVCGLTGVAFVTSQTRTLRVKLVVVLVMTVFVLFFGVVVITLFCVTKRETKKCERLLLHSDENNAKCCSFFSFCGQIGDTTTPAGDNDNIEGDITTPAGDNQNIEGDINTPVDDDQNIEGDITTPAGDDESKSVDEKGCIPFYPSRYRKVPSSTEGPRPTVQKSKLSTLDCFKILNNNEGIEMVDVTKDTEADVQI